MKMDDSELLSAILAREANSFGFGSGELAEQRATAIDRFLSRPYGDEQEGRSHAVSTDLRDTVMWVMPQLLRTFLAGDDIVRFEPVGPEDETQARIETDYLNHILLERNNAFMAFSAAFQDALLLGNGYAKVWWSVREDVLVERYQGKTDDEFAMLMQDPDVELEVADHQEYPDPSWVQMPPQMNPQTGQMMMPPPAPMLHDVTVRRIRPVEFAKFEAVPPEELYISRNARSANLQDVDFVQHRRKITISELREMGYDVPDDLAGWRDDITGIEKLSRDRFHDFSIDDDDGATDPASRMVTYCESYIRVDADGDGKAELRRVCHVASKILHNYETDFIPIVSFAAIPFAHRHHALGMYDLLKDVEQIKTTVIRQYLDGLRVSNNPRTAVDANRVHVDDLLTSRPNGIVRTMGSPSESIMPMPAIPTGPQAMEGLRWLESWRMDASGVSPAMAGAQGLDASALSKTATGISTQVTQALMRVEAIARSLADGVRELVLLLHAITLKHATRADKVRLKNQWVAVDPRNWVKRADLSVQVALGAGTKEIRVAQLQSMIAMQMQLLPIGVVTPDKIFNAVGRLANELGFRNADEFVSNPAQQQPKAPPPPDPLVAAQQIKSQTDLQLKQMDAQQKAQQAQMDVQVKQAELQAKVQADAQSAAADLELERVKIAQEAQTRIEVARIEAELKAQTALQIEQMKLANDLERTRAENAPSLEANEAITNMAMGHSQLAQVVAQANAALEELAAQMNRKANARIVRDGKGRVAGLVDGEGIAIATVQRDQNGRLSGMN